MALATKMKESRQTSTLISDQARERLRVGTRTSEKADTSIQSNPLYKIMFDGSASPIERKKVFAQFMTATLDKETDRARIKQYEDFREWLSHQNTELAQEIIALTNTGTFATLQTVIENMNSGLMDINQKMEPLNQLLESIHLLNTEDMMYDAYEEIAKEDELRAKRDAELTAIQEKIEQKRKENVELDIDSRSHAEKRGFFGFGGVPQSSKDQIIRNEATMKHNEEEAKRLAEELENLKKSPINPESKLSEDMQIHKERMREFLNLSEGRTVEQMQELVAATSNFVEKSKTSTLQIREEFGQLSERLDHAEDVNRKFLGVYGIMNEGMKDAAQNNINIATDLEKKLVESGDDILAKMDVEDKQRLLNTHSKMLGESQKETVTTFSNLTKQSMRVGSMKDSTTQQIALARNLNTEGVSTTADQLAMVVTSISGAAITESATVVENNLRQMSEKSDTILQKDVIRNAANFEKTKRRLNDISVGLVGFRETYRLAEEIVREGLQTVNEQMNEVSAHREALVKEADKTLALNTEYAHVGDDNEGTVKEEKKSDGTGFEVNF